MGENIECESYNVRECTRREMIILCHPFDTIHSAIHDYDFKQYIIFVTELRVKARCLVCYSASVDLSVHVSVLVGCLCACANECAPHTELPNCLFAWHIRTRHTMKVSTQGRSLKLSLRIQVGATIRYLVFSIHFSKYNAFGKRCKNDEMKANTNSCSPKLIPYFKRNGVKRHIFLDRTMEKWFSSCSIA